MPRRIRRMSVAEAARLAAEPFSYSPVGWTSGSTYPSGFRVLDVGDELGRGDKVFEHAVERLMTWRMHADAGLRVTASAERVAEGGVVRCGLGPLRIPCRVIWVREEPDARGFGYGTLPGHPEAGEEAFVVSRTEGIVRLRVSAYSRPGLLATRLAGPLGRWGQRRIVARYAEALRL